MIKRFNNVDIHGNILKREIGWRDFWRWQFRRGEFAAEPKHKWPSKMPQLAKTPFPKPPRRSEELRITFINHATFLMQCGGINIITDPLFANCAGPFGILGPRRALPPGVLLNDLPPIDYICLTHNHYDHMDVGAIAKLVQRDNPLIITGVNNGHYIKRTKARVCEMQWGEHYTAKDANLKIHYLRSRHWSHRYPFDQNWALWGAFALQIGGKKIYFAGDTAYCDHFKEAGDKFDGFDVSMLPIGAYKPRAIMQSAHSNPEEAVLAHKELRSNLSIAMHFGSFKLSDEKYEEPLQDLQAALLKHQVNGNSFITLQHGEFFR